jgi:hypothetical protein
MKVTQYFLYTRNRPDRKRIKDEWILRALSNPNDEEKQSDGRIRRWTWIEEEKKFLRVIILEDRETIYNAFFNRDHQES